MLKCSFKTSGFSRNSPTRLPVFTGTVMEVVKPWPLVVILFYFRVSVFISSTFTLAPPTCGHLTGCVLKCWWTELRRILQPQHSDHYKPSFSALSCFFWAQLVIITQCNPAQCERSMNCIRMSLCSTLEERRTGPEVCLCLKIKKTE